MKKELTSGKIVLGFLGIMLVLFVWCNIVGPVAGMGGGDYFQIASGGFWLNSENGCQTYFTSIPCENSYTGTMNLILRPLSSMVAALDVRVLATVYFLITITAFLLLVSKIKTEKTWHKILIGGVATFIFCDFSYLLHLNSLNPEGAFYCFILTMMCILLSQLLIKPGMMRTVLYLAMAFFVGGIKTGYFWIGIFLAVCQLPVLMMKREFWYRIITVVLTIAVSVGCVVCFGNGVYYQKEQQNQFHTVYYGVLKDNPDSSAPASLGLPAEASAYAGKTVYEVEESIVDDARYQVSDTTIATYYFTHPGLLWSKLERSADNGYEIRQQYNSNYPETQGLKHGFEGYSVLKRHFIQPDFWFVLVLFGAVIVFSVLQLKKKTESNHKAYHLCVILLCITALAAFVTPVFISGEAGLSAELFLYNILFDVVLCHVIIGGTIMICKRREAVQQKFGVEQ